MPLRYPDPPLDDGVVALRPWRATDADAAALAAAWVDPEIRRWLPVPTETDRLAVVARNWVASTEQRVAEGRALDLVVTEPAALDADAVAGEVGLGPIDWAARRARIGYWVAAPRRGRGVATRAVALLARFAERELGLDVLAEIDADNVASRRVADAARVPWVAARVRDRP